MKIILLGTGGPKPDPNRQGPSLALEVGSQVILFDAGRGAGTQLAAAGIPVERVNPVCITHHHFDHIGNLGDLVLSSWNLGRSQTLSVLGPEGTAHIVHTLLAEVYKSDIDFRMKEAGISGIPLVDIRQMVSARDVTPGLVYESPLMKVYADYVKHGHGLGISQQNWKCLGYRVEAEGKSVAISGDAVDCPGLENLAEGADLLVMCCYLSAKELLDREGELIGKHIIACSPQIGEIASRAGAGKLVLTHFREKSDALIAAAVREIRADFSGEVIAGRDLMVIDV